MCHSICWQISKLDHPLVEGWDGIYLVAQMAADDYWFSVKLEDNRIFKEHFTLKR